MICWIAAGCEHIQTKAHPLRDAPLLSANEMCDAAVLPLCCLYRRDGGDINDIVY